MMRCRAAEPCKISGTELPQVLVGLGGHRVSILDGEDLLEGKPICFVIFVVCSQTAKSRNTKAA